MTLLLLKNLFIPEPPCFTQLLFVRHLFEGDDNIHKYLVPVLRFVSPDTLFHPKGNIGHAGLSDTLNLIAF